MSGLCRLAIGELGRDGGAWSLAVVSSIVGGGVDCLVMLLRGDVVQRPGNRPRARYFPSTRLSSRLMSFGLGEFVAFDRWLSFPESASVDGDSRRGLAVVLRRAFEPSPWLQTIFLLVVESKFAIIAHKHLKTASRARQTACDDNTPTPWQGKSTASAPEALQQRPVLFAGRAHLRNATNSRTSQY